MSNTTSIIAKGDFSEAMEEMQSTFAILDLLLTISCGEELKELSDGTLQRVIGELWSKMARLNNLLETFSNANGLDIS